MSSYTVRKRGAYTYHVIKFDDDFNVIIVDGQFHKTVRRNLKSGVWSCTCMGQQKHFSCRHITIVKMFEKDNRLDTGYFYDYEFDLWYPPIPFEGECRERREVVC